MPINIRSIKKWIININGREKNQSYGKISKICVCMCACIWRTLNVWSVFLSPKTGKDCFHMDIFWLFRWAVCMLFSVRAYVFHIHMPAKHTHINILVTYVLYDSVSKNWVLLYCLLFFQFFWFPKKWLKMKSLKEVVKKQNKISYEKQRIRLRSKLIFVIA